MAFSERLPIGITFERQTAFWRFQFTRQGALIAVKRKLKVARLHFKRHLSAVDAQIADTGRTIKQRLSQRAAQPQVAIDHALSVFSGSQKRIHQRGREIFNLDIALKRTGFHRIVDRNIT